MSKGSNRRPSSVSNAEFERRWADTFRGGSLDDRVRMWADDYWREHVANTEKRNAADREKANDAECPKSK